MDRHKMETLFRTALLAVVFFQCVCFSAYSRFTESLLISGTVTDAHGNPIAGCSIYLSNTSYGAVSSSTGSFIINNLPKGRYDLIVSAIGYETKVINVSSDEYPKDLKIIMGQQSAELEEVVVEAYDDNGWKIWGDYFIDNFIGVTLNAKKCKLVNRKALRFRFNQKANRLTVKAIEPLIIDNNALGYRVQFQLIDFIVDFNTDVVSYLGYPLFEELETSDTKKLNAWIANRKTAYQGSVLHFMRSVYTGDLRSQNFVAKVSRIEPNFEKNRIQKIMKSGNNVHKDSIIYYNTVLLQGDTVLKHHVFPNLDTFVVQETAAAKFIHFRERIDVLYFVTDNKAYLSGMLLASDRAIQVQENGSYFSSRDLLTTNYWGENEKMCNMLPYNYIP
jgi:hypothetical protein